MGELNEIVVTPQGSYTNYEIGDYLPTRNEYIISRQDKERINAANIMSNLNHPIIPRIPNRPEYGVHGFVSRFLPDALAYQFYGEKQDPRTCLFTALYPYGLSHSVPGNVTFSKNPMKYGFMYVDDPPETGGIIQQWENGIPIHAGMQLIDKVKASEGGITPESIKEYDNLSEWEGPGIELKYLTFVGNNKDHRTWNKDYDKLKKRKQNK